MTIQELVRERIPHAPQMGLYVRPDLPAKQLENALSDYASGIDRSQVLALYDATLSGTGSDGAIFTTDRFVFQNNDFQSVQTVRYRDLVGVDEGSRWFGLGGKKIDLKVNRGRATFELTIDFSGASQAAEYVADFLHAAMLRDVDLEREGSTGETDVGAVRDALDGLRREGTLSDADYGRLIDTLEASAESGS